MCCPHICEATLITSQEVTGETYFRACAFYSAVLMLLQAGPHYSFHCCCSYVNVMT